MLVNKNECCVVIFNMQLELIPLLHEGTGLLNSCCWMVDVARTFAIPVIVIEHKKLGDSSQALKEVAGDSPYYEKTYFDGLENPAIRQAIESSNCSQFILAGAESHVCLYQSALGLQKTGVEVFVVEDSCSARNLNDHRSSLQRMDRSNIHRITREMFFFELIRHSEYPQYRENAMNFLDGRYIR